MKKSTIEWNGVDYIVRIIDIRTLPGFNDEVYKEATVATHALDDAIKEALLAGGYDACKIDEDIFFYADTKFINSEPTDEQLLDYLREHLCSMTKFVPVSKPEAFDFFSIEYDELHQKQISILGFTYLGDNWKCIDVRGICLPLSEFIEGMKGSEDYVQSLYECSKEYERDVTDEECVKAINGFYAGKSADYRLLFGNVNMETPIGNYVNFEISDYEVRSNMHPNF